MTFLMFSFPYFDFASVFSFTFLNYRYRGDIKNFKINRDANGQYSVSSKKFPCLESLLEAYSKNPFRSKKGGTEIFLKYPIPVDKDLERRHMQMQNEEGNSKLDW